jgi:hypothetical protein
MRRSLLLTAMAVGCMANTACNRRLVGVLLDMPALVASLYMVYDAAGAFRFHSGPSW